MVPNWPEKRSRSFAIGVVLTISACTITKFDMLDSKDAINNKNANSDDVRTRRLNYSDKSVRM